MSKIQVVGPDLAITLAKLAQDEPAICLMGLDDEDIAFSRTISLKSLKTMFDWASQHRPVEGGVG